MHPMCDELVQRTRNMHGAVRMGALVTIVDPRAPAKPQVSAGGLWPWQPDTAAPRSRAPRLLVVRV